MPTPLFSTVCVRKYILANVTKLQYVYFMEWKFRSLARSFVRFGKAIEMREMKRAAITAAAAATFLLWGFRISAMCVRSGTLPNA